VTGDLVVLAVLPPRQVVIGLAAVYGLVTLTGAAVAWPLQLRRVGSLDGWRISRSLVRMFLATLPGLVFAFATMAVVGLVFPAPSVLYGLVSTVVGGGGALLLYAICAKLLGIEEFHALVRSVAMRLGRLCNSEHMSREWIEGEVVIGSAPPRVLIWAVPVCAVRPCGQAPRSRPRPRRRAGSPGRWRTATGRRGARPARRGRGQ
jgi:hypothetical protein